MFRQLDFGGLLICYTWVSIELITVEIISVAIFSRFSYKMTRLLVHIIELSTAVVEVDIKVLLMII